MKIYTIGFTQKKAQDFFETLRRHQVRRVVDIRLKPNGQLAGFARQADLPYFLSQLADGCAYIHLVELSPTEELFNEYRATGNWEEYVLRFESLLDQRDIPARLRMDDFIAADSCLLCSEATPDRCHRRLVAERLAISWPDVHILHL